MIPKIIRVDRQASETGADICTDCVKVRPENLDKLLSGFKVFFPNTEFVVEEESNGNNDSLG